MARRAPPDAARPAGGRTAPARPPASDGVLMRSRAVITVGGGVVAVRRNDDGGIHQHGLGPVRVRCDEALPDDRPEPGKEYGLRDRVVPGDGTPPQNGPGEPSQRERE